MIGIAKKNMNDNATRFDESVNQTKQAIAKLQ
jgi:hypothetical protein